ncbi:MAG TPA: SDR family oxidoreductase [Chryseosolibacter sp.]|nr:SDR family oxidoreductase [Chryseosolibacter sp.]
MDLNLRGKRAVVCGSTRGIGKAIAIELAILGAAVTALSRNEAGLKSTVQALPKEHGQNHEYLVADFNFPEKVKSVIGAYAANNLVHILVNNTGGPPAGLAIDAEPEAYMQAFSSHLICNQILVQALIPGMKTAKYGRVINVISTSVKIPLAGLGVSNTIRGAVANWAKTLSVEVAPYGITVNNLLPGATETDRLEEVLRGKAEKSGRSFEEVREQLIREIPAKRLASANEIAAAAAFLASPAAGYINGINLPVDGGRTGSL